MDRAFAKSVFFNVVYKIMNVLFPLITATYSARVLLPEGIGRVSYAQTIASYFALIAALGIPAYGVKVIAGLGNKKEDVDKNFSSLYCILIVSALICTLAYVCVVYCVPYFRNDWKLYAATGLQIFLVAFNVDWFYQAKEMYAYIALRSFAVKICSLIAIFIFVHDADDYIIYALIASIATAGNYLANVIQLRKYTYFSIKGIDIESHIKPVLILFLSILAIELYSKVDITMLGIFCNEENVGYYSNAVKVINVILMGVTAITSVFLPRLSQYYKSDRNRFEGMVNMGTQILVAISLPCSIGLFLLADDVSIALFGQEFLAAGEVIRILSPLLLIKGVGDLLCYQVIISVGKEKYFLLTNGTAAILNILLNSMLIPSYAQAGAAVASVISELVVNVGMIFVTQKVVKLRLDTKVYVPILVSSLLMGVSVGYVNHIGGALFQRLVLSIVVGIFVYLVGNITTKNKLLIQIWTKCRTK